MYCIQSIKVNSVVDKVKNQRYLRSLPQVASDKPCIDRCPVLENRNNFAGKSLDRAHYQLFHTD